MINRFGDYDTTKAYGDFEQLPKGGYVLTIMGAEVCQGSNGQYVKISCDVAEGEYKGFFARDYRAQQKEDKKWRCNYLLNVPNDDGSERDAWTKRRFKTVTEALEESNAGYHFDWDESKFKGKLIGGLFNEREYQRNDGNIGRATNLAQLCNVEKIRTGNYTVPKDKLLDNAPAPSTTQSGTGWMDVPASISEELPFN